MPPAVIPLLALHISHVFGARAKKQVAAVAALSVIACMKDAFNERERSMLKPEGDAVGEFRAAMPDRELAVPALGCPRRPLPTFIRSTDGNFVPKTREISPLLKTGPEGGTVILKAVIRVHS